MTYTFRARNQTSSNESRQSPALSSRSNRVATFRPSQMQVGFPRAIPEEPTHLDSAATDENTNFAQNSSNELVPTFAAAAPQTGKSTVVRPGEPHHFGTRIDGESGEIMCTLCRCRTPMLHGDAYTMLNSPRGNSIDGMPIDWQTGKKRMLDHYGKDQISHQQEVAAIPFVFDRATTAMMLLAENDLRQGLREGKGLVIDTERNSVSWHNDDGHARADVTERGLRTRVDRRI